MTDQEINVAMAKARGERTEGWWCYHCRCFVDNPAHVTFDEMHTFCMNPVGDKPPRDDCNDLNVMWTEEDSLNQLEKIEFAGRLNEMFYGPTWTFDVIHATARQRAEAFLKCKDLWREDVVKGKQ